MKLTFAQITQLLAHSVRHELVDHAFGDAEVRWETPTGELIADGYFGSSGNSVCSPSLTTDSDEQKSRSWKYEGHLARLLRKLGTMGRYERNDSGENVLEAEDISDEEFWA